jgi:DNA-binding transcriptional LysR family regulator
MGINNVDLRHIRCFVAVAEELHFRRAAERLGIAQPALSRTIRDLERDMGVVLLERSNRYVQLTKAGQVFLDSGRGVLRAFSQAVDTTRLVAEGKVGLLTVGYTDFAIAGPLPAILKRFRGSHPDIAVQLRNGVSVTQLRDLEDGLLDVGFVTGPIAREGFAQTPVSSEAYVCILPDTHPLAGRDSVRLQDLRDQDFVHGNARDWEVFFSHLFPLCRRAGFAPRIVQEGLTTVGILGLVASGVGLTILTESVSGAAPAGTRVLPITDLPDRFQTMAIWRDDRLDGARKSFIDTLAQGETLSGTNRKGTRA